MKRNRKRLKTPLQVTIFEHSQMVFDKVFDEYPIVIGRSPKADISFPQYDFISKQHAALVEHEGETLIVDLESSNGFYFQGKRSKRAPVTEDGLLTIGALTLRFRFIRSEAETGPTEIVRRPNQVAASSSEKEKLDFVEKPKRPSLPSEEATLVASRSQTPQAKAPSQRPAPIRTTPQQEIAHGEHHSILNSPMDLLAPHPHAKNIKPELRVLEGYVTWKGLVYDVHQFVPGEKVTIGRGSGVGLSLPTLSKKMDLAFFDGRKTQCFIPPNANLTVKNAERELTLEDLLKSQAITKFNSGYLLKLGEEEIASFDLGPDIEVHFRYAPAPRRLKPVKVIEPDEEIRRTTLVSGIFHGLIMAIALLNSPPNKAPKIANVPERYARLLVEPPRKIIEEQKPPPPPPPEKVEPPKLAEKPKPIKQKPIVKRIVQERPKKVVLKQTPLLRQVNKRPTQVVGSPKATPSQAPVNVNALGALSALTAVSSKAPSSSQPVAININKNAGGPSNFTTTGVLGTLKSSSGQLRAGGIASVQTKGLGVGSGTGYGIQGLKGAAGSRGVAGGIVGSPQIMSVSPDEGLTRAQVMSVVKKHIGEIQQCYERGLFQTPGLAGKVEYEWEIQPKGGVSTVRVKSSQMTGADAMNTCVFGIFRKMKFPVAKNGQMTVPSLPLEFGKL